MRGCGLSFNKSILGLDYLLGAYYVLREIEKLYSGPVRLLVLGTVLCFFTLVGIMAFALPDLEKTGGAEKKTFEGFSVKRYSRLCLGSGGKSMLMHGSRARRRMVSQIVKEQVRRSRRRVPSGKERGVKRSKIERSTEK